jgi:hypothetical protein
MVNEFVYGENHDFFSTDAVRLSGEGQFLVGGVGGYGQVTSLDFGGVNSKFCCRTITWADNLIYHRGKHSIAAGVQGRRIDPLDIPYLFPPSYTYNSLDDLQANVVSVVSFVFGSNPAPGNPNSAGYIAFGPDNEMQYGYYVQDDWKVSRRLTLNLGLRYDYWPALTSTQRTPCCSDLNVVSDIFGPYRPFGEHMWATPTKMFSPRFGFAYDLTGSGTTSIRGGFGIMRAPPILTSQEAVPYLNPGSGVNTGTVIASEVPGLHFPDSGPTLGTFDRDLVDPHYYPLYSETWTLTLEHALSGNTLLRAIYTGDHTLHNEFHDSYNVPISPNGVPVYPVVGVGEIRLDEGSKESKYESLQVNLQHRFRSWNGLDVFYTWSHGLDNIGTTDSAALTPNGGYQDISDARDEYASNSSDIRHNLLIDYILKPPIASWAGLTDSWASHLISGWGFEGITSAHTGFPVNITTAEDIGNLQYTQRPNLVPGVPTRISGGGWANGIYNSAAYAIPKVPEPVTGYIKGDLGSRTERGPGYCDFDFAITRDVRIREHHQLQFRVDSFNLFNQTNFGQPISVLTSTGGTFGRSLSASTARQLQFGIRYMF